MVFGRKKPADELSAADRARLVEGIRPVVGEIDDIISRCEYFLDPLVRADVPEEYLGPLEQTLERERFFRARVLKRIETIPTEPIVLEEIGREFEEINRATSAANDLLMRAGSDASTNVILDGLKNNPNR